jgi:hypothetical protein
MCVVPSYALASYLTWGGILGLVISVGLFVWLARLACCCQRTSERTQSLVFVLLLSLHLLIILSGFLLAGVLEFACPWDPHGLFIGRMVCYFISAVFLILVPMITSFGYFIEECCGFNRHRILFGGLIIASLVIFSGSSITMIILELVAGRGYVIQNMFTMAIGIIGFCCSIFLLCTVFKLCGPLCCLRYRQVTPPALLDVAESNDGELENTSGGDTCSETEESVNLSELK